MAFDEPSAFFSQAWQAEGLLTLPRSGRALLEEFQKLLDEHRAEEQRILGPEEVRQAVAQGKNLLRGRRLNGLELNRDEATLRGQDLRGCKLTSSVLNEVCLEEALLDGADLCGSLLEDAKLSRCRANGINLVFANANRARLDGANLTQGRLMKVALQGADLTEAVFTNADLPHADLQYAHGAGAVLTRTDLTRADLSSANLPGASFRDALLLNTELDQAVLSRADFSLASLPGANFRDSNLTDAHFYFANLKNVDFSGAKLERADFTLAWLDGAKMTEALNLTAAQLEHAVWQKAHLPQAIRIQLETSRAADALYRNVPPLSLAENISSNPDIAVKDWQELVDEFLRGNCLVIVGPGLTMGVDYSRPRIESSNGSAAECDCPTEGTTLEDVAQLYAQKKGRQTLEDTIAVVLSHRPDSVPDSLKLIAALPFAAVATTEIGPELDTALAEAQRPAVHTESLALGEAPRVDRGDLLVMHLFGRLDRPSSLVLTRRDQLQLQAALASSDNVLADQLKARTPLFVGFSPRDPWLYAIHSLTVRGVVGQERRSFVAFDEPSALFSQAWQAEGLLTLPRSGRALLEEFQKLLLDSRAEEQRILDPEEVRQAVAQGNTLLRGRRLNGLELNRDEATLHGQDLRDCKLTYSSLNEVCMEEALLDGADLSGSLLEDAQLSRCRANGINLMYVIANRIRLDGANLAQGWFMRARLQGRT